MKGYVTIHTGNTKTQETTYHVCIEEADLSTKEYSEEGYTSVEVEEINSIRVYCEDNDLEEVLEGVAMDFTLDLINDVDRNMIDRMESIYIDEILKQGKQY